MNPTPGIEWETLIRAAHVAFRDEKYKRGEVLAKKALEVAEQNAGKDHESVADSLKVLAMVYRVQGQYAEAEPLLRRAIEIWETVAPPVFPRTFAEGLGELALLYEVQGQYEQAEPIRKRALALYEELNPKAHARFVGIGLHQLASLYEKKGELAQAELLHRRALAIREKANSEPSLDPEVADSLTRLAEFHQNQGELAIAETLFTSALATYDIGKKYGKLVHDERVDNTLRGLARLYIDEARYVEAEPLLRRSLAIREQLEDPDHPYLAMALENMALLYRKMDRDKEAEQLEARAKRIRTIKR